METSVGLRCSPAIRALGVDPCGSAPGRTSFLLVEWPLPWPADLSAVVELAPVHQAIREAKADGRPWRLQGVVPGTDDPTTARVVAHGLPDGPFRAYERRELRVAPGEAVEAAAALVRDPGTGGAAAGTAADLLVCTHGRRDACCGGPGTALWTELQADPALAASGVRALRTSHTGGHRFAPTAIHLPSGTCWAWLDAETIHHVLRRDVPLADLADRYRGSTALASPAEQVAERAVFADVGWTWLDQARSSRIVATDGAVTHVELVADGPAGRTTWTADVELLGTSPVPECGAPLDEAPKSAPVLRLVAGSLAATVEPVKPTT